MRPDVDAATKRSALKVLLSDPRFNVMDGLDVYIDDYSKPDPLPAGWLEKMNQVARLGIFAEPRDEPREPPTEAAPALQKPAEEQRLAPAAASEPLDTSSTEAAALKGAESSSSQ